MHCTQARIPSCSPLQGKRVLAIPSILSTFARHISRPRVCLWLTPSSTGSRMVITSGPPHMCPSISRSFDRSRLFLVSCASAKRCKPTMTTTPHPGKQTHATCRCEVRAPPTRTHVRPGYLTAAVLVWHAILKTFDCNPGDWFGSLTLVSLI